MIWEWHERFDQVEEQTSPPTEIHPLGDDDGVFEGLRLVEPHKVDVQHPAATSPAPEPRRFKDVQMRDHLRDDDQDEGTGQEPS